MKQVLIALALVTSMLTGTNAEAARGPKVTRALKAEIVEAALAVLKHQFRNIDQAEGQIECYTQDVRSKGEFTCYLHDMMSTCPDGVRQGSNYSVEGQVSQTGVVVPRKISYDIACGPN